MLYARREMIASLLLAMGAIPGGNLLAQPALEGNAKPASSAAMTETEAKLAKLRQLIKPQPGEHVSNMAKIAWEHDPWEAAVKAGREGKPILAWGECGAGVPCGYG